jgi:hypothetical protein
MTRIWTDYRRLTRISIEMWGVRRENCYLCKNILIQKLPLVDSFFATTILRFKEDDS